MENSPNKPNLIDVSSCICNFGYKWSKANEKCEIDCSILTNATECAVPCPIQCSFCAKTGCQQCIAGYTVKNNICLKCLRGCSGTCNPNNIT